MEEDQRAGRENDPSPHSPQCGCSGVPCGGPYKNGIPAKDISALPEGESEDELTHEHSVQLDLSGPTPKIYTTCDGGINWKEAKPDNPIVGAFIERLQKQPGTVEVIGLPKEGDNIPDEVMKRIERIGMAMADKLGKDCFDIVTIIEDKEGNQRVKRAEYLRSNPVPEGAIPYSEYIKRRESMAQGGKKEERFGKEMAKRANARREAVKVLTRPAIKTIAKTKKRNLNFREIEPVENRRVYVFPGNHRVIVENTCRIAVMDSGIHRLETTTGQKHIIPAGWLQVIIDAKEWAF